MRHLLVVALVLLAVICLAEGFSLGAKPLSFAALKKSIQANKLSGGRAKRSLAKPLFNSPAQNAVSHAAKAAERIREKRSIADAAQKINLDGVSIDKQAVNEAMQRIKKLQKRAASLTEFKFEVGRPVGRG